MLPPDWGDGYPNVWLGISAENQHYFNQRWKILSTIPARIRFISYKPALGPLSLRASSVLPDWIIVGGESGRDPRQMDPQWARDLRDECAAGQPLIEFAEGAQQVREQFRKQALEAIHTAADEQQQADANSGGRL